MSVSEIKRRQQQLEVEEDLAPYAGKWVALRNGRVVGSDVDAVELTRQPDVRADDVIMRVDYQEGVYLGV
jgi:hypothetical protein